VEKIQLFISYLITVVVSYILFRVYFKLNKDDKSYDLAFIAMFIPIFNIVQSISLIIGFTLMKVVENKKLSLKKFFGVK
jgi:hypothetical protein